MIDALKKTLFTGLGLAVLTKEKLVELSKEVAKQAELSESQAKEFQEDLEKKADEAKDQLQAEVDRRVAAALERLHVVRAEQYEALAARVAALESRFS